MLRYRIPLVVFLAPLLFSQQASISTADQSRFKVQSSTVVVDVIVTDSKGNVVNGLAASDFQVFENKAPQKLLSFDPPALPVAPVATPASGGGPSIGMTVPDAKSFRTITIVLDQSSLRPTGLMSSIQSSTQFVETSVGPDDFVAVYTIGASLRLVVPFTREKQKVLDGIRSLSRASQGIQTAKDRDRAGSEMNDLSVQYDSLMAAGDPASKALAAMVETERLTIQAEQNMMSTLQTRALFRSLRALALASGNLPGRKNVLLYSEGLPTTAETTAGVLSVVDAANRVNVAFYVIDPSGLNQDDSTGNFDAGNASNGRNGANTQAARDMRNVRRGPDVVAGETKFDQLFSRTADANRAGLQNLAEKTGGFIVKNRNELKSSLDRIDRDLREFYTLTYQSSNPEFDGSYREIRVDVSGKHNIRYRKGYYAMAPADVIKVTPATAQLLNSVASGTLKSTVKPKINAALVFGRADALSVPVSVWLPGEQNWVTKSDKGYAASITLVITARDANGQIVDVFQKYIDAQWSKEEWKTVEKKGIQVLATLTPAKLEPLDIQAVFQFASGGAAIGSVKAAMPASPDTSAHLTSLFLTPRVDPFQQAREGDPESLHIADYQLTVPTEMRFTSSDKLTLYFGMDNVPMDAKTGSPRIGLTLSLKSGEKVIRELPADSLYPWANSKTRIFFLNQFDLAGLAPGNYTVQATLKDLAAKTTVLNSADFSIQ